MNLSYRTIQWIDSYLRTRSQVTKVSNHTSLPGDLSCGVPQGSILGPLFFIAYINSLPQAISNSKVFLYADDTAIVTTGRDVLDINDKLTTALTEASNWMYDNKLSLNLSKTKCMFIGTAQRLSNIAIPPVVCKGEIIESVTKFKYLGIIIDRHLKFDEHVKYLKGKIYAKMKTLSRVRQFISQGMSLDMYKSLVIPHLDFGDVVYDAVSKTDAQTLQVLQNQCLRICLKANPRTPIKELHTIANVPMLAEGEWNIPVISSIEVYMVFYHME